MKIKFWGVRGSIPSPLLPKDYTEKIINILSLASNKNLSDRRFIDDFILKLPEHLKFTYGGNTSCVSICSDETCLVMDAGTGLRNLGKEIELGNFNLPKEREINIILSHLHWDHINGLPFFGPLHSGTCDIHFYSCHKNFKDILSIHQNTALFPVDLESVRSIKQFNIIEESKRFPVGDLNVDSKKINHPNNAYSYSIHDCSGKKVVYATDGEYFQGQDINEYCMFYEGADVLIFDWQYSSGEISEKKGFGHSSFEIGINIAVRSKVKKLVLFHHNHDYNDETLYNNYLRSLEYLKEEYPGTDLKIIMANEGLEIEI